MEKYYLIDLSHNKKQIWLNRLYETASKIAIKYGGMEDGFKNYKEEYIREFWDYDTNCPTFRTFQKYAKASSIKWFIHNKFKYDDEIWNPDFLNGILTCGKIRWSKFSFPSFKWSYSRNIDRLIRSSPFGGKISINKCRKGITGRWIGVPALYLKHSKNTVSYIAGIMAGAELVTIDGVSYARFRKKYLGIIKSLKIPIENQTYLHFYISPIWVALFTLKMPLEIRNEWLNAINPFKANIYAPILWKTYVSNTFKTNGIPFLKSRRMIFYEFSCEEGATKRIEKMRVELDLTELDNRIIEMVKEWGKRYGKSNIESTAV